MVDPVLPALVAVLGGLVVAAFLLAPFVAVQVRRHGRLTAGRSLVGIAAIVYSLALVAYTLLPLPTDPVALCVGGGAGTQLLPGQFVLDAVREQRTAPGLLQNPAVQQVALNVALFVPLGALVRHVLGRGVLTTTGAGLGVSALVEVTQGTAVWGLFPCPYRLLDVDDLIANTLGALLGALVAPALRPLSRGDGRPAGTPRPLTRRRRLLGMLCDVLLAGWATLVLSAGITAVRLLPGGSIPDQAPWADVSAGVGVALGLLVVVLRTRRTPGELAVRLRPRGQVEAAAAVARWGLGIGGYVLLQTLAPGTAWASSLAVASVVAVLVTRRQRGLAYRLVGWELEDDRHPRHVAPARDGEPARPSNPRPAPRRPVDDRRTDAPHER